MLAPSPEKILAARNSASAMRRRRTSRKRPAAAARSRYADCPGMWLRAYTARFSNRSGATIAALQRCSLRYVDRFPELARRTTGSKQ